MPKIINYAFLRKIHWGIVVVCFFLPVVQGCQGETVFPCKNLLETGSLLEALIFFYPLILALVGGVIFRIVKPAFRFNVLWWLGYLWGLFIAFLLWQLLDSDPKPNYYYCLLVILWGIVLWGLLKSKEETQAAGLIGFSVTSLALWLFPLVYLFSKKVLIGGWLFTYANGFVILTYIVQVLERRIRKT